MGVSTDGQLSFGVVFDECFEFPWDSEEFDGDYDEWWQSVNGYENPNPCPYGDDGGYKPGMNRESPEVKAYHAHSIAWRKENPFPVEIVNYCSGDCPMYLLAVKHVECSRIYRLRVAP